ncbi:MAG: MFS transporter, partial [Chloroflexota bacterium]
PEDVGKEQGKRWAPPAQSEEAARAALSGHTTGEALRTSAFWLLMTGMTLQQFARTAVSTQLIPHLEQVGLSAGQAAAGVSLMAFFAVASKIISGRVSESMPARHIFAGIIVIQIVAMGALAFVGGSIAVWPTLALFGLGIGGVGVLSPLSFTEAFGLRYFGSIMGLSRPALVLPLVGGPLMAGLIFDATGTYDLVFGITVGLLAVSAVCMFAARPPRGETAGE